MTDTHQALPAPSLEALSHDIKALIGQTQASIISIGQKLQQAKALLPYGAWLPWLAQEFAWSERTAQRAMAAADLGRAYPALLEEQLPIEASVLYLLSHAETPKTAVAQVIREARRGQVMTSTRAQAIVRRYRPPSAHREGPAPPPAPESSRTPPPTAEVWPPAITVPRIANDVPSGERSIGLMLEVNDIRVLLEFCQKEALGERMISDWEAGKLARVERLIAMFRRVLP